MRSDISYLGGILDGEGCFSIQKSGGTYRTTIQVANNSVELIQWMHKTFGGSIMAAHKETTTCEAGMVWILASKPKIVQLLPTIIPELIVKRVQASILLDFCTKFNVGRSG